MNLLKIKYHNKENKINKVYICIYIHTHIYIKYIFENSQKCRLRRKFKGYKKNII